ncbi:MAG: hypothetical protein V3R77_09645 [Candidatus Binatia bacterium]
MAVPHVAVIRFEGDRIASEHIYWGQATVLVQLGVIDSSALPVPGVEQSGRVIDRSAPANRLIERFENAGG